MSAEETLKKITEAARNLEIEKNDKRSRALAQAFYEKLIVPIENKKLKEELETVRSQVNESRSQINNWQELEREMSSIDKVAKNVHSLVYNSESGAHCLPTLQKQVFDTDLQRRTNRLQTLTKKKEELEKEYMDDPSVRELMKLKEYEGKTAEELSRAKEETKKLQKRRNELITIRTNQRNNFILQLLEEKRKSEEKQEKLSKLLKTKDDQKKEKERVLRAIEEKKRIVEEYRKKNQQLEERMRFHNSLKCNQLGHINFADFDTLSVSSVRSESSPEQELASNEPEIVNSDGALMGSDNMRGCSVETVTSERDMSAEPQTVNYTSSVESMEDDSATAFDENIMKQNVEFTKIVATQKSVDERMSVSEMRSSVSAKSGNIKETVATKHAQTTSSAPAIRSHPLLQRNPQTMTECKASANKPNMGATPKPEEKPKASAQTVGKVVSSKLSLDRPMDLDLNVSPEPEEKPKASAQTVGKVVSSKLSLDRPMDLDLNVSPEASSDGLNENCFSMGFDFDYICKMGSDFDANSNADGISTTFEYSDNFLDINMEDSEVIGTSFFDTDKPLF